MTADIVLALIQVAGRRGRAPRSWWARCARSRRGWSDGGARVRGSRTPTSPSSCARRRWSRRRPRGSSASRPTCCSPRCWWPRSIVPVVARAAGARLRRHHVSSCTSSCSERFFLALAGLDAGSAFGGMGVEPRGRGRRAGRADHHPRRLRAGPPGRHDEPRRHRRALRAASRCWRPIPATSSPSPRFFIVMLAETGRLPVDNPATHLELTMIHEAMVLEYSGHYLALVEWAAAMKLFLFLTLLANLFFPWGMPDLGGARAASCSGSLVLAGKLARAHRRRWRWSRRRWPSSGSSACPSCWPARSRWPLLSVLSVFLAHDDGDLSNLLAFLGLVVTLLIVWRQSWPARLRLLRRAVGAARGPGRDDRRVRRHAAALLLVACASSCVKAWWIPRALRRIGQRRAGAPAGARPLGRGRASSWRARSSSVAYALMLPRHREQRPAHARRAFRWPSPWR